MFQVPILIVIYNRIEETHNLFQIIRQIAPKQLFVAADGEDKEKKFDYAKCIRTRNVIKPEWDCELKTFFSDEHLGKAQMVYQAISWFFDNVPEGIILFDDNLPHLEFFPYCELLLDKYRDNSEIMHISGSNFHKKKKTKKLNNSYYFSAYSFIWGFATWKRVWDHFDLSMEEFEDVDFQEILSIYMEKKKEKKKWLRIFNILNKNKLDLWEYKYNFHIWLHEGLCITPKVNLVKNVGFKHGKRVVRKLMKKTKPILPLNHPTRVRHNKVLDKYTFKKVYKRSFFIILSSILRSFFGKKFKL